MELSCVLRLYRQIDEEITNIETEIKALTLELNRPCLTILKGLFAMQSFILKNSFNFFLKNY